MKIFDARDFIDEHEFDDDANLFFERGNRKAKAKSSPTGGTMSAQKKRMEENNFYAGVPKSIKKDAKINEES